MPSIELEGHSEAEFTLIDGKIVRIDKDNGRPDMGGHGGMNREGPEALSGPRRE